MDCGARGRTHEDGMIASAELHDSHVQLLRGLECIAELRTESGTRNGAIVERRPLRMTMVHEDLNTLKLPRIIDRYVDALIREATADPDYSVAAGAEIFARWHRGCIRRCRQTGQWYVWDGRRWIGNALDKLRDAIDHFCTLYGQAALQAYEGKAGAALQRQIASNAFRRSVESIIESKQELLLNVDELDADDWVLNVPDGIIDLHTGDKRPHDPAALCTKITNIAPTAQDCLNAEFPESRFARFLEEIFAPLPEEERRSLIDYLQQALGYCLTGDNRLHFLLFWLGEGRNGKSTFGEVMEFVMGDYAKKISNTVLMSSRNESHPTEIANLQGVRLAIASEISEGAFLAESKIKELCGDARIAARYMRCDWFQFRRTHKHLIYGNSKPRIRVADAAMKSRIKLIEFGVNFEANGRLDPQLKSRLEEEAPLILAWLIQGVVRLSQNELRLTPCAVVERQTDDYMAENDLLALWLEDRCLVGEQKTNGDKNRERPSVLYRGYADWRRERGEHPESEQRFSQLLAARGFRRAKSDGVRFYEGVSLAF